jgi:protease I
VTPIRHVFGVRNFIEGLRVLPSVRFAQPRNSIQQISDMANQLADKKVAILVADGFEQVEMTKPRTALQEAGAETKIVSLKGGKIQGMQHMEKGDKFDVDLTVEEADPVDFDALMIPGGLFNPDSLRADSTVLSFTRHFFEEGKPVAAICHGPWVLVDADVVRGRTLTSWPRIKTDIRNAGGNWVDKEVVVDNGLVTSRKPDDIPAFNRKMIEEFCEGRHAEMAGLGSGQLET